MSATQWQECVASGQSCVFGPYGRHGERQCQYCGAAQPVGQPSSSSDVFKLDQYEQAGLLALLRSLELEGHRHSKAAEYLRWTFEGSASVVVHDEAVEVNVAEYVRLCDAEAGL
ncbi:hypothetical protein ACEPMY_01295 [Ralstonia pseudosolanacearum]|uniref:hypothetical protein n=1 Tax=Ralstonia pseudosolanacearum TaxID=1310165 RepID=UPI00386FB080